jgi:uncharacterized protein
MLLAKVETVTFDEASQMGIVLLTINDRTLPIWVGLFEAQAVLLKLQNSSFPRPLTHDLLKNCIEKLDGRVEYVYINDIVKGTFYAQIHISRAPGKIIIDSRPSDAIALAVRVNVPIYIDEKVFETSSVDKREFLEQQKEKLYRSYLESLGDDEIGKLKH